MTRFEPTDGDETFDVSTSPDSVTESVLFEGANVCRVAMLSTRFSDDRRAIDALTPEWRDLGFDEQLFADQRPWRLRGLRNVLDTFTNLWTRQDGPQARARSWAELNESATPEVALRFLLAVLGSSLERESAAAAAALWRQLNGIANLRSRPSPPQWVWAFLALAPSALFLPADGDWLSADSYGDPLREDEPRLSWSPRDWEATFRQVGSLASDGLIDPLFAVLLLVRGRLGLALRSVDPVTASLALAASEPSGTGGAPNALRPPPARSSAPGPLIASTMIHGTWGWKGDWWRPRSPFHDFILRNHRPNLYSRGAKYSWSGALSERQRIQAAADFCDWASDVAPDGLQTVFAHSYGGEVASRAVLSGSRISELVLLSTPVTPWVELAIPLTPRVVDVRLRLDPILAIAQTRQRILHPGSNTTTVLLGWRYLHGSTHEEAVWRAEDIAERAQL